MALGDVIERSDPGEASKELEGFHFRLPQSGIYEHYKGGKYRLLFLTERHTHNGDMDAVYVSITTGKVCTRPVFFDSRKEDAWQDIVEWHNGQFEVPQPRFRYVEP